MLCAMKRRTVVSWSPSPAGFEAGTPWCEFEGANHTSPGCFKEKETQKSEYLEGNTYLPFHGALTATLIANYFYKL